MENMAVLLDIVIIDTGEITEFFIPKDHRCVSNLSS
jgi:hypothetical protein